MPPNRAEDARGEASGRLEGWIDDSRINLASPILPPRPRPASICASHGDEHRYGRCTLRGVRSRSAGRLELRGHCPSPDECATRLIPRLPIRSRIGPPDPLSSHFPQHITPIRGHVAGHPRVTMGQEQVGASKGLVRELGSIARCGRQVWIMVPRARKLALVAALGVIAVGSFANARILLAHRVARRPGRSRGSSAGVTRGAIWQVALVLSRHDRPRLPRPRGDERPPPLPGRERLRQVDKDLCVRIVGHLMMVDLGPDVARAGRLAPRADPSLGRGVRPAPPGDVPGLHPGDHARRLRADGGDRPGSRRVALAMLGVAPISIGLTVWQLMSQKGIRLGLMRISEAMDGTVVEQLTGLDYVRAANTHEQEIRRVEEAAERRRSREVKHHFQMSLFGSGKALNEGFFHLTRHRRRGLLPDRRQDRLRARCSPSRCSSSRCSTRSTRSTGSSTRRTRTASASAT